MHRSPRLARLCVGVLTLAAAACGGERVDVGSYRVVRVPGGVLGFGCQPRTELYLVDRASPGAEPVYLGTCSTPRYVTEQMQLPGDPSCFAIARDGRSLVYFHRPRWCGAGEKAARKPGGVYLHSVAGGDSLRYGEDRVGQVWSRAAIGPHAIRVGWHGTDTSRGGAVCSQRLVIGADGSETPEGEPTTVHGCRPRGGDTGPGAGGR